MASVAQRTIDYGRRGRVVIFPDSESLASRAADFFAETLEEAVTSKVAAFVALSGGSTPKRMGELLAGEPYSNLRQWRNLHVFWGDERWVPLESDESNAGVALRTFLERVPVPREQIYPMANLNLSPDQAASRYEEIVRRVVPSGGETPQFDLVLLGMGDDGHTASLFPHTAAVHENVKLVVANHVPKLNATRLTMTPRLINAASSVVFLVSGSGKAARLAEVLEGPERPDDLPSQVIRPDSGNLLWLVDEAAAASLEGEGEAVSG
jgi:6-phosphogluconolactonase